MKMTPKMIEALRVIAARAPKPTETGWRTTAHYVARGSADALVARGLVTMREFFGERGPQVEITEAGRSLLASLDAS